MGCALNSVPKLNRMPCGAAFGLVVVAADDFVAAAAVFVFLVVFAMTNGHQWRRIHSPNQGGGQDDDGREDEIIL